jgi:hypothetical protein
MHRSSTARAKVSTRADLDDKQQAQVPTPRSTDGVQLTKPSEYRDTPHYSLVPASAAMAEATALACSSSSGTGDERSTAHTVIRTPDRWMT